MHILSSDAQTTPTAGGRDFNEQLAGWPGPVKERRRTEILDAAEAIANARSWDALTMKHVALRARLSRALLYMYFNDKAELLSGIRERGFATLARRFAEAVLRNN
jgi:AcrR family transcriptional regulator